MFPICLRAKRAATNRNPAHTLYRRGRVLPLNHRPTYPRRESNTHLFLRTELFPACHRPYSRQESNLCLGLRSPLFCPLNYGSSGHGGQVSIVRSSLRADPPWAEIPINPKSHFEIYRGSSILEQNFETKFFKIGTMRAPHLEGLKRLFDSSLRYNLTINNNNFTLNTILVSIFSIKN